MFVTSPKFYPASVDERFHGDGPPDVRDEVPCGHTDVHISALGGLPDVRNAVPGGHIDVRNAVPSGLPDVRNAVLGGLPDVRNAVQGGPPDVRNAVPGGLPDVRNALPGGRTDVRNAVPGGRPVVSGSGKLLRVYVSIINVRIGQSFLFFQKLVAITFCPNLLCDFYQKRFSIHHSLALVLRHD